MGAGRPLQSISPVPRRIDLSVGYRTPVGEAGLMWEIEHVRPLRLQTKPAVSGRTKSERKTEHTQKALWTQLVTFG